MINAQLCSCEINGKHISAVRRWGARELQPQYRLLGLAGDMRGSMLDRRALVWQSVKALHHLANYFVPGQMYGRKQSLSTFSFQLFTAVVGRLFD